MSFKIPSTSRKQRIEGRFLGQVHTVLARAFETASSESGITQAELSRQMEVDRSFVSRLLTGGGNPTARTIGAVAGILGYRPELVLHKVEVRADANHTPVTVHYSPIVPTQTASNNTGGTFFVSGPSK